MKIFIISDIHGSYHYLEKAMELFEIEHADYILILGDILYHGARNDLPKGYSTKDVTTLLNKYADRILAVRGNCDSEVDQMVLSFPITADYSNLLLGNRRVFITHGHLYHDNSHVNLPEGSCFLNGHTHLLRAENIDGIHYLNPGSISIPKGGNPHTYGLLTEEDFTVKSLDGKVVLEHIF